MLRTLTYHRVADPDATPDLDPKIVSATPGDFRVQMEHVARRYRPVSLDDVLRAFGAGAALPHRAVLVTFDDAYRDFGDVAFPILKELGIPVTLFVPTDYPGRPARAFPWDRLHRAALAPKRRRETASSPEAREDAEGVAAEAARIRARLATLPRDVADDRIARLCATARTDERPPRSPVLDWDELRAVQAQGVAIGSHTHTHPALAREGSERRRLELRRSREILTRELGEAPLAISYPHGSWDDEVVGIAREEGYVLGFTTEDGLGCPGRTEPLALPRTNISRRTGPSAFALRMRPWFARVDRWRHSRGRARLAGVEGA